MANTTRLVTQEELAAIPAPTGEKFWIPRSHNEILNVALSALPAADLRVQDMQLITIRGAQRFLGLLQTDADIVPNKKLIVGVCNSTDKSLPQGLFYGLRSTGDNELLLCSTPETKKHTTNSVNHFDEIVAGLPASARKYVEHTRILVERLLAMGISDQEAESIMLRVYEQDIISHRNLPHAIKGWRHATGKGDTDAFSLLLAIDGNVKKRALTDPPKYVRQSVALRGFFEGVVQARLEAETR